MKLNPALVKRTLSQFPAEVIPDNHPAMPELNRVFGDHTFFVDGNGLHIVEPAEATRLGEARGAVVKLASWEGAGRSRLTPHEPLLTDVVVLGPDKPDTGSR